MVHTPPSVVSAVLDFQSELWNRFFHDVLSTCCSIVALTRFDISRFPIKVPCNRTYHIVQIRFTKLQYSFPRSGFELLDLVDVSTIHTPPKKVLGHFLTVRDNAQYLPVLYLDIVVRWIAVHKQMIHQIKARYLY